MGKRSICAKYSDLLALEAHHAALDDADLDSAYSTPVIAYSCKDEFTVTN